MGALHGLQGTGWRTAVGQPAPVTLAGPNLAVVEGARPSPLIEPAVAGRLAVTTLLDAVEVGRGGRPLLDWLVLTAVGQRSGPGPARVEAIASTLRLTPADVTRRLARLDALGDCALSPDRRSVSRELFCGPEEMAGAFAACEQIGTLYHRLRELGLWRSPDPDAPPLACGAPMGAFRRLFGDYVLRSVEAATPPGCDPAARLLLLAILRANQGDGTADAPRPAAVGPLARRLGLSEAQARRLAASLVAEGRCHREQGRLIALPDLMARPRWIRFTSASLHGLNRMLAGLEDLGVLAAWEAARPAPAGPSA